MRTLPVVFFALFQLLDRTQVVLSTCATHPVDCQVVYGEWSDCDPCTYTQSRHINITTPAQSGGVPCPTEFTEEKSCSTTDVCSQSVTCGPSMFLCQTGRCISTILKCNGEDDCGDNSDEQNCSFPQQFSQSIQECMALKPVPYLDLIGSGYNFLTGEMRGRVLDNDRFDGYCRKVQDGDTGMVYRLPYNLDTIHFQVEADGQSHANVFDSLANFTNAMQNDDNEGWSLNLGFNYKRLASFSTNTGQSQSSTYKQIHQLTSQGASTIFQVGTSVALAQFSINKQSMILDPFFFQTINELPVKQNAKAYYDFIEQYGTHFQTGGSLGGTYDFFNVFYQTNNSALWANESTLQNVFKFQFNLDIFGIKAGTNVGNQDNSSSLFENLHQLDITKTQKVVVINGGTSQAAGELTLSLNTTQAAGTSNKYSIWVNSLKQNPAVIQKKLTPICDLIYVSKVENAQEKWKLCLQSLAIYLNHFSTDGCKMNCTNNGVLINLDKTCYCACAAGFTGQQCATKIMNTDENLAFSETANLMKFITQPSKSGVPTTTDPVPLVTKTVGSFDQILKGKGSAQYFISSDNGERYQNVGNFSLKQVDDLLMNEHIQQLNLNGIDCNNFVCEIVDFDLDSNSNVILSLKQTDISKNTPQIFGNIYQLKAGGEIGYTISNPCAISGALYPYAYVSVNCQDELIVGCYANPATLRLYDSNGLPDQVIQFSDLTAINSLAMSEVDGSLWLHTVSGQLASYDMNTWERKFYMQGPVMNSTDYSDYCQISIDFMGNVIIAQARSGSSEPKFVIVDPNANKPVVAAFLSGQDNCQWVSSYRGRVYLLCSDKQSSATKTISVYDYLK